MNTASFKLQSCKLQSSQLLVLLVTMMTVTMTKWKIRYFQFPCDLGTEYQRDLVISIESRIVVCVRCVFNSI